MTIRTESRITRALIIAMLAFAAVLMAHGLSAQTVMSADTCQRRPTVSTPWNACHTVRMPEQRLMAVNIQGTDTSWVTMFTGKRVDVRVQASYGTTQNTNPKCLTDARIVIYYRPCP